ncbi:uncharacterized protein K452DRAFT_226719 [Aplosporella prunicola CBS 121167]|uniref:Uncharacterized protein n=1 Tax=Aplosporella prunicola CBS 121167 TaxID=1176127 RepID=A0A6A6BET1_9PEZI|nr:uncharacterized protein K452DRAFT_226719 [Aplosporella prunicola CBS 121167]KAF2142672.1 hypothetical protein K452DRAFT_226719 [Aplosporella prunicola CBS 121167]
METDKPPPPPSSSAALDVIFNCHICQATISDIYNQSSGNSGFRDGRPNTSDTRVTSLWLTECMHLTCGSHLEGGGAPFHPEGARPEAACPVCVKEAHDDRPKPLYAVRGWKEGAYDEDIPEDLFVTPPVGLDGKSIKVQALQFQYTSLLRYGTAMLAQRRAAEKTRLEAERRASEAEKRHREMSEQVMALKCRVTAMEKDQAEVSKWKARMPQITHYLKLCPELIGYAG